MADSHQVLAVANCLNRSQPDAQFQTIWTAALSQFSASTKKNLDDSYMLQFVDIKTLEREIDRKQLGFSAYRSKREKLFGLMAMALKPVELLGGVAAGGASLAFPPSSLVFGAVVYMIQAARDVSASYDAICDLFDLVKAYTTRLTVRLHHEITTALMAVDTKILCSLIRICGYTAHAIEHGRIRAYVTRFFIGEDQKVAGELENMKQLQEEEERLIATLTFSVSLDSNKILIDLQDQVSSIIVAQRQADVQENNDVAMKALDEIKKVLSPTAASEEIYRAICKARLSGTGEWVQKELLFQEWLRGAQPVACITGGPGAGKSYLASKIIEILLQQHPQGTQEQRPVSVAYFFCKDTDHDLRSFISVLKSLAYQICRNDANFAKHIREICSFPEEIKTIASLWQRMFEDFYGKDTNDSLAYIVVDGVDEADDLERATFLQLLNGVKENTRTSGKARLRLLVIGRPEIGYEMEQVFQESVPVIIVSAGKNAADIEKFVNTRVIKEFNFRRISSELRDEIKNTLIHGADGMFLWVDLMLKEVAGKHTEARMRKALRHMPAGLYKAMHQTFLRLSEELSTEDAADLNTMLEWVTCAKRPLTLGELDDVLKMTSEEGDGVIYLEGQLRKRYASIFTVNREDGRTTGELQFERLIRRVDDNLTVETTDVQDVAVEEPIIEDDFDEGMDIDSDPSKTEITLAHNSFGSFFRQESMNCKVRVDVNEAEIKVLKTLLNMIRDGNEWRQWIKRSISLYAAEFWQDHLQAIDLAKTKQQDVEEICQYMIYLFRNQNVAVRWAQQNKFLRKNWFYTETNNERVHAWLWRANLENEQAAWLKSLYPASAKEVTDGLIAHSGREWLQSHNGDPNVFFMRIKAHHGMVIARNNRADPHQAMDPEQSDASAITAATIISLARSFDFEEDNVWNIRLGIVLRVAGHYEEALEHFQTSVGQGEELWRPWFGMARTYSMMKQPDSAIEAVQKCLEIFESDHKQLASWGSMYTNALCFLGNLQADAGDNDGCLSTFQRVFEHNPHNFPAGTRVVGLLLFKSKITEAMQILDDAQQDKYPGTGASRLDNWVISMIWSSQNERPLGEFYHVLVEVCRQSKRLEFAVEAYKSAIKVAMRTGASVVALLSNDLGSMLLREYGQTAEAEALLEGVMDISRNSRPGSASYHARRKACKVLCNIHVDRAITGGRESLLANEAMAKLASIWTNPHDATRISGVSSEQHPKAIPATAHDSTLCLGVLYRHFGHAEQARRLFREHVRLVLSLLTDDDPENDQKAYARLGKVLLKAGDDIGTIAARTWIGSRRKAEERRPSASSPLSRVASADTHPGDSFVKSLRREDTAPISRKNSVALQEFKLTFLDMGGPAIRGRENSLTNTSSNARVDRTAPYHWRCQGRICNQRDIPTVDGLYSCRLCLNMDFEEGCYQLLMQDKLPFKICSKNHEFLKHPVLRDPVPDGMMFVDGKYVPEKEWLEDLRKRWEL